MEQSKSILYNSLRGIAVVAALFSLVIFVLITTNFVRIQASQPLDSPGMATLRTDLRTAPGGPAADAVKQEIRSLDQIARRAYFSSLLFTRRGAWLLFSGVIVMLICLKTMSTLTTPPPAPGKYTPPTGAEAAAARNRRGLAIAGLVLFLVALSFSSMVNTQLGSTRPAALTPGPEPAPAHVPSPEDVLANWPSFRGPNGLGVTLKTGFALNWDGTADKNILWKVPVPAAGFSSPIVWGKHLFLSGGTRALREVMCFNTDTGDLRWRQPANNIPGSPPTAPELMEDVGYAPSTMATDGKHAFAIFPTGDVIAFDFTGKRLWARNIGLPKNAYGYASSLLTHDGRLFIQYDNEKIARVLALQTHTGETAWEQARKLKPCWSTPILITRNEKTELVLNGHPHVMAYDPMTGKLQWQVECMAGEVAPSPAYDDGLIFATTEYEILGAIQPGPETKLLWETDEDLPDVSSPVAGKGFVFVATGEGILSCWNAKTGKRLWMHEFDDSFVSSPILVGEHIYLMDKEGVTVVVEAKATFKQLAQNPLGEEATCTPAFVDKRIYIRGKENLYCIGTE